MNRLLQPKKPAVRIGLEVHCQLTGLRTKLFCSCPSEYRGKEPNANVCHVCLGIPGTLPVLNRKAMEYALRIALALGATPATRMLFYRKNYFYPDMAKNFQISQYDRAGGIPLASGGRVVLDGGRAVNIRRIHLEEDPARIAYEGSIEKSPVALVDYNRHGVALVEVVTEPEMESPHEARKFLDRLRTVVESLGVCDAGLEGALRCDANISLEGGGRVEIKNISSVKEVERALNFEIARQRSRAERGMRVTGETRHWDEVRRITITLRSKEEEQDYRYFPEPDLPPVDISPEWLQSVSSEMPELPDQRRDRYVRERGISVQTASVLTGSRELALFFEELVALDTDPREAANWLVGEVLSIMNRRGEELRTLGIRPESLAALIRKVVNEDIGRDVARRLLWTSVEKGVALEELLRRKEPERVADEEAIRMAVREVLARNPETVEDYKTNPRALNFLVGQVMKEGKGSFDSARVSRLVQKELEEAR